MNNFSSVPGSLYGVDATEVDVNVRFGKDIHSINVSVSIHHNLVTKEIVGTIIESKLVATQLQLLSLVNRYGGICDISFTTSQEFTNPGLLLMELRGCCIQAMQMDLDEGDLMSVYRISIESIFDVGDPAPWDYKEETHTDDAGVEYIKSGDYPDFHKIVDIIPTDKTKDIIESEDSSLN